MVPPPGSRGGAPESTSLPKPFSALGCRLQFFETREPRLLTLRAVDVPRHDLPVPRRLGLEERPGRLVLREQASIRLVELGLTLLVRGDGGGVCPPGAGRREADRR